MGFKWLLVYLVMSVFILLLLFILNDVIPYQLSTIVSMVLAWSFTLNLYLLFKNVLKKENKKLMQK